jgi:hypothetical protein
LKNAIRDAMRMRGTMECEDLGAYRSFDEIIGRKNARNLKCFDAERALLQPLPDTRTADYEEELVYVTTSGGFVLRKVFYTVPSRLIRHRLRARLYDDQLELFVGGTRVLSLVHGRRGRDGKHGHVIDYHQVIHALGRKPMALLNLVYRDQLWPREAYRHTFDHLCERLSVRAACKLMVELLSLAHDLACEALLAAILAADLDAHRLPDLNQLRTRFVPDLASLPPSYYAPESMVKHCDKLAQNGYLAPPPSSNNEVRWSRGHRRLRLTRRVRPGRDSLIRA